MHRRSSFADAAITRNNTCSDYSQQHLLQSGHASKPAAFPHKHDKQTSMQPPCLSLCRHASSCSSNFHSCPSVHAVNWPSSVPPHLTATLSPRIACRMIAEPSAVRVCDGRIGAASVVAGDKGNGSSGGGNERRRVGGWGGRARARQGPRVPRERKSRPNPRGPAAQQRVDLHLLLSGNSPPLLAQEWVLRSKSPGRQSRQTCRRRGPAPGRPPAQSSESCSAAWPPCTTP